MFPQNPKFQEPVTLDFLDAELENDIKVEVECAETWTHITQHTTIMIRPFHVISLTHKYETHLSGYMQYGLTARCRTFALCVNHNKPYLH